MMDFIFLGALLGAVAAVTPAVYLAVRVALAELPDRPVERTAPPEPEPVPLVTWKVSDQKCSTTGCETLLPVGNLSGLCGQCGYELLVRERKLAHLERAHHALQPFGLYTCAGKRGDQ